MTRFGLLCGSLLLMAACSGGTTEPTSTPTSTPTTAPIATPSVAPTTLPTPTPVDGVGICPTGEPITVQQFSNADPECFGGKDFVIQGWLEGPPGIGFEGPQVEPAWVAFPADGLPALWASRPVGPDRACPAEPLPCAWFFLHVNPVTGLNLDISPREIVVTGHLDDPASATCHYVYPADWTDPRADDAEAVARCRGEFVVVSFRSVP